LESQQYERQTIVEDERFGWQPSNTTFERVATGEVVSTPSVGWFQKDVLTPDEDEGAYLIVDDGTGETEHQIEAIERRTMSGGTHAGTRVEVS